ncbi:hypothetical protein [Spirillospora sp. CA-294931]|uniref:hypothetical protein n=1 Tax=Spirillospora sp. CA-294931 TaxID=3240042 RepID=UPI003D8EF1BF
MWALGTAAALGTVIAVLHTFVRADPTIDALMDGNAPADAQQGLRMMWHGMTLIAWTCPVVLLLLRHRPATVTRPALGFVALLNGSQAVLYAAAAVAEGASGPLSLPHWALHAPVAILAWLARPPRPAEREAPPSRPCRQRLVVLVATLLLSTTMAILHFIEGTFLGWAADLLSSDTGSPEEPALYVMWLFSCVLFASVPLSVAWSLRAPVAAGRFVVRYNAVLMAALMASWARAVASGEGDAIQSTGWIALALLSALTALSAPRPKS